MKRIKTRIGIVSAGSLVFALACGAGGGTTDLSANHSALAAGTLRDSASEDGDDADEEESNDKIVCAVDADCDSDEVCTNGLCSDPPGAMTDADDLDDDEADDDGPGDKLVCTVDADCDSDEVCGTGGRCTDPSDHQGACSNDDGDDDDDDDDDGDGDGDDDGDDADDEADDDGPGDKLVCTVDADCDSDEVCANGKCR